MMERSMQCSGMSRAVVRQASLVLLSVGRQVVAVVVSELC